MAKKLEWIDENISERRAQIRMGPIEIIKLYNIKLIFIRENRIQRAEQGESRLSINVQ